MPRRSLYSMNECMCILSFIHVHVKERQHCNGQVGPVGQVDGLILVQRAAKKELRPAAVQHTRKRSRKQAPPDGWPGNPDLVVVNGNAFIEVRAPQSKLEL